MTFRCLAFPTLPAILAMALGVCANTVVRGRNEGTYHIGASNVSGNGNITLLVGAGGGITREGVGGDGIVGLQLGIAEIMQMKAQASFEDFQTLGPAQAHLQITTPGNNRLRLVGFAVAADLFLSTAQDTISFSADSSRPFYSPYLMPSAVVDVDLLALESKAPFKTYVSFGLVDNPQLMHRYSQLAFKGGFEWKMFKHSAFIDGGLSMYREKRNKLNTSGDSRFEQSYAWIRPGGRYRLFDRFSVVGGLGITFFQKVKQNGGVAPDVLSLTMRIEAPIVFRETDTEAIRTLVFMEKEENTDSTTTTRTAVKENNFLGEFDTMLEEIGSSETFDYGKENQDLVQQRKKIQEKMAEIEQLLKEEE